MASNSPKFESPRRRDGHEDHKSSRWPPHPEDEEKTRESDPWSPDVFREITDINEFHNETQEEEAKSGYFGPAPPVILVALVLSVNYRFVARDGTRR